MRDDEVKFGLSVTGTVHPDRILRNSTARPGDRLLLTKPLGTGALVAALKKGRVDAAGYAALVACMTTLNRCGTVLWRTRRHRRHRRDRVRPDRPRPGDGPRARGCSW